jgi:hypothetical protein
MSGELGQIRNYLGRLTRWERVVVALRIGLQAITLVGLLLVCAVLAVWAGVSVGGAWVSLGVISGVGLVTIAWTGWTRWRPTSDRLRQALLVEARVPSLRGAWVTTAHRLAGPEGGESAAVLQRVAMRAEAATRDLSPGILHPVSQLRSTVAMMSMLWGLALLLGCLGPGGQSVWAFWASSERATAAIDVANPVGEGDEMRVGDIHLRYIYPPYTGLDPLEVSNATGDIEAPAGTRVELAFRTASVIESASLVAYGDTFEATLGEDGRAIEGDLIVSERPGMYRLDMRQGDRSRSSAEFALTPMPDLAPEVVLDLEESVFEVGVHEPIVLPWQARDDYGVARVALEVDGHEAMSLHVQDGRAGEVSGQHNRTPGELGLRPGEEARLVVVAWDNDTWSGSKSGRSIVVRVQVVGGDGQPQRNLEGERELMEEMLPVLARVLTFPRPKDRRERDWAAWGEQLSRIYHPLFERAASQEGTQQGLADLLLQRVLEASQDVIRYTQVAFDPRSDDRPASASLSMAVELDERSIQVLEDGVLSLDRSLQSRARMLLQRQADQLDALAIDLTRLLVDPATDPQAYRTRRVQLGLALDEVEVLSDDLAAGGLQTFLKTRGASIRGLLDEATEALEVLNMERSHMLLERSGGQIHELAQGIRRNLEAGKEEESEVGQAAESLVEALRVLEQDQRELMEEVKGVREREDAALTGTFVRLWDQAEAEIDDVLGRGERWHDALRAAARPFYEGQRAESAIEQTQRLQAAIHAHDLGGAWSELQMVQFGWDLVMQTARNEEQASSTAPASSEVGALLRRLGRVESILTELQRASLTSHPEVRAAVQDLESRQRALAQRLGVLEPQVQQVLEQYPVRPDGLEENVEAASTRMAEAKDALGEGKALEAEGAQGMTSEHLKKARESLQEAMRQAARESSERSGSRRQGEGESQDGSGRGGDEMSRPAQEMGIPTREDFQTPEAYRDALLRGMEGEVPAQYRALKKRYYEELVHQ